MEIGGIGSGLTKPAVCHVLGCQTPEHTKEILRNRTNEYMCCSVLINGMLGILQEKVMYTLYYKILSLWSPERAF